MTTPELDVRSEIDEPSTRLKIAKILQDYKNDTVDYIRTAEAIETLMDRVKHEAEMFGRINELDNTSGDFDGTVMCKNGKFWQTKQDRIAQLNLKSRRNR